jgi:HAUS augmin-like complex subunit 1
MTAISRLSSDKLSVKISLNRLKSVEDELIAHLASVQHEERLIIKYAPYAPLIAQCTHHVLHWARWKQSLESDQQTDDMIQKREACLKRAKEYGRQLEVLTVRSLSPHILAVSYLGFQSDLPQKPRVTVNDLMAQKEQMRKKETEIKAKTAKLKVFRGLPPVRQSCPFILSGDMN